MSLTRGGIFLIAILCGGDYDETGLRGCGITTAHELACTGLGDSLLHAAESFSANRLAAFLVSWRRSLCEVLVSGQLSRKHPAAAAAVDDSFPSLSVIAQYAHPLTSWSPNYTGSPPHVSLWVPQLADIPSIATLCKRIFGWSTPNSISSHFNSLVWEGIYLRRLYQVCFFNNFFFKVTNKI